MPATTKPRKRDRLKAVFRNQPDRSVSAGPTKEAAIPSTLQPSPPQEDRRSDAKHQETTPNPTATLGSSVNFDNNNDETVQVRTSAQDGLWEVALSKLETSSSMEDRSHARALREFANKQEINAIKQIGNTTSDGNDLIERVKHAADQKRAEVEQKAWKIEVGTRTIVLRDVVTRIIDCLNKFKEIGDLAVQYDPVHAALPWAAFRLLLQAATMDKEETEQLLAGIDAATQAYLRARIYQDLYLGLPDRQNVVNVLKNSVIDLLTAICSFLGLSVKYISSRSIANTARGLLSPESLAKCIENITKTEAQVEKNALFCKAILDAAAHQSQGSRYNKLVDILEAHTNRFDSLQIGLTKVEAEISQLMEALSEEEIHRIFLWISEIPYESDLHNAQKDRLEGTCEWLIAHETYEQWKASAVSTILWLHGIPGAGKTKLATKVVDDLTPMGMPLAYFFCDRNQENRRDPLNVLHSITRQLSRDSGPNRIKKCTVEAYNKKKDLNFASDKLTDEESRDLILELANGNPINTILIDGLDECNEKSRIYILDTLDYLLKHSKSVVKVFVASRNDKDLTQHYSSLPNLEIEAEHNQDDIEKLVMYKISQNPWAAKWMSVHVRDAVVRLFREKSQGMFQWASLHIDELLELESNQAILKRLYSLPEGLKATYDRIYIALGAIWYTYANRAFMWLIAARHHEISPESLCVLICQDVNGEFDYDATLSPDNLLRACRNLIKVDASDRGARRSGSGRDDEEASKACRFAHLSVQEYLEGRGLNIVEAERMVLQISLKFWQYFSAPEDQKNLNHQDSKAQKMSAYKHTSTYRQLQWLTAESILDFFKSADMSETNQDIWDQLLQTAKSYDVVLGSPCWRAIYEDVAKRIISAPLLGKDELRVFASPIGMCAWFENQTPIRHWIGNGLFNPVDNRETARDLVLTTYRLQRITVCNLLLDKGTTFEGESSHMLETRLRRLFEPLDTLKPESRSTLIRLLNQLFDHGLLPNSCPSHQSVYDGTYPLEVARILFSRGMNPNVSDSSQRTPLMHAVSRGDGNMEMTKLLLQYGADVDSRDVDDETPLHYAAQNNEAQILENLETLRLLLVHGADPNDGAPQDGTPLMRIVRHGDERIESTKLLLQHGADVNSIDKLGQMPLHYAARAACKYLETMRLLLDLGADPNAGVTGDTTPLQLAALDGDIEAVKLLLKRDARVDTISSYHGTALHASALRGSQGEEIYGLLLEHGADPDLECEIGEASRSWGKVSAEKILQTILMEEKHGPEKEKDGLIREEHDSDSDDSSIFQSI